MFYRFSGVDRVFILPGRRFLLMVAPLLRLYRFLFGPAPALHLVVIGGWLPTISRTHFSRWILGVFDSVSPEVADMALHLESRTLHVEELPNLRHTYGSAEPPKLSDSGGLKLVFVSRINRAKGVFDAIDVAQFLHSSGTPVSLTFFGPLLFESDYDRQLFDELLSAGASYVSYGGVLLPDDVMGVLPKYDCLLFPSTYSGEGFPGIIVESMLAGTPVIAKNHLFLASLNLRYDFGFVIGDNFVEGCIETLLAGKQVSWRAEWESKNRRDEVKKLFGDAAFQEWYRRVRRITAR
jgi:glycosyltransferase involved in cell wall biosynthesis